MKLYLIPFILVIVVVVSSCVWAKVDKRTMIHEIGPEKIDEFGQECLSRKDFVEIRNALQMAADQAQKEAYCPLALLYYKGEGGPQDLQAARRCFQMAAEDYEKEAYYYLALMCYRAEGGPQDLDMARKYFFELADETYRIPHAPKHLVSLQLEAYYRFAQMCESGEGAEKDLKLARIYYTLAADQGYTDAQQWVADHSSDEVDPDIWHQLAIQHGRHDYDRERSSTMARHYYQLAADQGHRESQYDLARMFSWSLETEQKYHYYHLAAAQGHVEAQYRLADLYADGEGRTQDLEEAKKYYTVAANQGHKKAGESLHTIEAAQGRDEARVHNTIGVQLYTAQNYTQAAESFNKAAQLHYPQACYNLGMLYCEGRGVEQDYDKACELFKKATKLGLPQAHAAEEVIDWLIRNLKWGIVIGKNAAVRYRDGLYLAGQLPFL